jgi:secreted PhoX family phosphatase
MELSRRDLLKRSAFAGAGLAVVGSNLPLLLRAVPAGAVPRAGDPSALVPDPSGLLDLPAGFSYQVVTIAGDQMAGSAGLVPGRPDGTGMFTAPAGGVLIVRNHEQSNSGTPAVVGDADHVYDPAAMGGTTTLRLDAQNTAVQEYVSLAGTFSNCAGGVTPWGTWLSCEETEQKQNGTYTRDHGYVFEVDPSDDTNNRQPTPLTGLGRFPHEAAVVDPTTGIVYLTEDASSPNGLLYRFVPATKPSRYGDLRGDGELFAMYVPDVPDLSVFTERGTTLDVQWKSVPDPSALVKGSTRKQFDYVVYPAWTTITGEGGPITRSKKFEGMWFDQGKVFIVCSYAHGAVDWSQGTHDGQVWSYQPGSSKLRLETYFPRATNTDDQPDGPDNITVSPYGGLFLAEDGEGTQHLLVASQNGETSFFARNAMSGSEFTGVVFSPDGKTLYANIQDEGYTFAITGPFAQFHRANAPGRS